MKKIRYHYVSLVLVIVMAVSGFTGCSSKEDNYTAASRQKPVHLLHRVLIQPVRIHHRLRIITL